MAHPNKFDGEDRGAHPAFTGCLKVKFLVDSEAIGGETEKVWYGYGFLIGKSAERVFPWLASAEDRQQPLLVTDFFFQLDAVFEDPQSTQKALKWINKKKQGSQPFRDFLQGFEQKLLKAGGWGFSDSVRKGYLRAAMSRKIERELVAIEEPASCTEFVNQLRRTSDNLENLDQLGSKRGTWAKPYEPVTTQGGDMEWGPSAQVSSGSTLNRSQERTLSAKRVAKEGLEQRRANHECLRCGSSDRFVSQCRRGPAKKPVQSKTTAAIEPVSKPSRKAKKAVIEKLSSGPDSDLDLETSRLCTKSCTGRRRFRSFTEGMERVQEGHA